MSFPNSLLSEAQILGFAASIYVDVKPIAAQAAIFIQLSHYNNIYEVDGLNNYHFITRTYAKCKESYT